MFPMISLKSTIFLNSENPVALPKTSSEQGVGEMSRDFAANKLVRVEFTDQVGVFIQLGLSQNPGETELENMVVFEHESGLFGACVDLDMSFVAENVLSSEVRKKELPEILSPLKPNQVDLQELLLEQSDVVLLFNIPLAGTAESRPCWSYDSRSRQRPDTSSLVRG